MLVYAPPGPEIVAKTPLNGARVGSNAEPALLYMYLERTGELHG